jgi:hypothetical protein
MKKLFENVDGNIFKAVSEMGQVKDPAKLSPKYKRAKELALTDFQLGYDAGWIAVMSDQRPENMASETKSWKAGFMAGVSAAQDEKLGQEKNPYNLRR